MTCPTQHAHPENGWMATEPTCTREKCGKRLFLAALAALEVQHCPRCEGPTTIPNHVDGTRNLCGILVSGIVGLK